MADLRQGPAPIREGYGQRFFACPHYEACLDRACVDNWQGFTCEGCRELAGVDPDEIFDVHAMLTKLSSGVIPAVPIQLDPSRPGRVRRRLVVMSSQGVRVSKTFEVCPVCGAKARARGLCQRHYQRWYKAMKTGQTDEEPLPWAIRTFGHVTLSRPWPCCRIPGCELPVDVAGLCSQHYFEQHQRDRADNPARMEEPGCYTAT